MRLDKTRTAQEQKVANLLRLLGFSLKTDYRPQTREFDVVAVLGPLAIAVECKDYAEASAGMGNIADFYEKLRDIGNILGIFVANRFTSAETRRCNELGIAYWTTSEVEDALSALRAQRQYKLAPVSMEMWNLLSVLKSYANLWNDYIEDWVIQREIRDTPLFEEHSLIEVDRTSGEFSYRKTTTGEEFFEQFRRIRLLIASNDIGEWEDRRQAACIIEKACSWDHITAPNGLWDRMILTSLGIHEEDNFQLTSFGRCLRAIVAQIIKSRE